MSLAILLINDLFLKLFFPSSFIVGKLSDIFGLIAFYIFLRAILRIPYKAVMSFVILAFIFWKSELSRGLIDRWNSLEIIFYSRVVDYSDLFALLSLPFVEQYLKNLRETRFSSARLPTSCRLFFCLVAFAATPAPIPDELQQIMKE